MKKILALLLTIGIIITVCVTTVSAISSSITSTHYFSSVTWFSYIDTASVECSTNSGLARDITLGTAIYNNNGGVETSSILSKTGTTSTNFYTKSGKVCTAARGYTYYTSYDDNGVQLALDQNYYSTTTRTFVNG